MARRLPSVRSTADGELAEALRPGLHRTHIALLSQSRHRCVREAIAGRDDVPLGVQAALANDDWHEVRASMAANPRAARSVLDALAQDRHHAVLLALITNPVLPHELAEWLTLHKRPEVRAAASKRMATEPPSKTADARGEDHLVPELRERAAMWGEDVTTALEADQVPAALDDAQAAVLGAAARAAAPAIAGTAIASAAAIVPGVGTTAIVPSVGSVEVEAEAEGVPAPAFMAFEPGDDLDFDDAHRRAGTEAHPEHDFLVVTLPDDLGPSRAMPASDHAPLHSSRPLVHTGAIAAPGPRYSAAI